MNKSFSPYFSFWLLFDLKHLLASVGSEVCEWNCLMLLLQVYNVWTDTHTHTLLKLKGLLLSRLFKYDTKRRNTRIRTKNCLQGFFQPDFN